MKTLNFQSFCASFAITMTWAITFVGVAGAETIYLGTGTPVTSGHNNTSKNVAGTVTDANKDGYADGRGGASGIYEDVTNTRDAYWHATYTDVFKNEYKKYMQGNESEVNARRSAVEYVLSQNGNKAYNYTDGWTTHSPSGNYKGSTGSKAAGTVYGSTSDLLAPNGIGMTAGGLSNFSVNGAGVITTYGGGYFDEAGQYTYNPDNSISYIGHDDFETIGFMPVQSGIVAFSTGFTSDSTTQEFNYINGTFSVLGELLGIYLNGVLLDASQYFLSDDMINSGYDYAGLYNFELDLSTVEDLLVSGNNNISFMVLGIPHSYTETDSYLYNESMAFINLSADIYQNTQSIITQSNTEPATTPEPATLLIFGIGLVGLGLRKRLMDKKSAYAK
ncbi:MAG: PEP-CTERM sorting domain-containing protein [Planctomycetaceae bacterium]|jgi:hypothetical protein|nr:PEP-CTERM sorting domain-containing protein [Planctomycetaceae bacterium]